MEGLPDPGSFGAVFEDFMRAMTARPEPEPADLPLAFESTRHVEVEVGDGRVLRCD